jgi:hypothetical protein
MLNPGRIGLTQREYSAKFRNVSGNIHQNANKTKVSETSKHLKHLTGDSGGGNVT